MMEEINPHDSDQGLKRHKNGDDQKDEDCVCVDEKAGNEMVEETSSQNSDQGLRWLDFLAKQSEVGDNLLKAMELMEEDQCSGQKSGDDQKGEVCICDDEVQSAKAMAPCYIQVDAEQELKKKQVDSVLNLGPDGMKMWRLWDSDDHEMETDHRVGLKEGLSKDIVDSIAIARSTDTILKKCDNKVPKEKWGHVLLQRQ
jgi:hypothetical protein